MAKIPRYVRCLPRDIQFAWRHVTINLIAGSALVPRGLRIVLYNLFGIKTGRASIYPHIRFISFGPVKIAANVMLNAGITIDNRAAVTIERSVSIGPEVYIGTATHEIGPQTERAGKFAGKPVSIGSGTWIGARAVILPGVTIGRGCVIAAGSVVTRDCAPNGLYAGVPAKRIRDLSVADSASKIDLKSAEDLSMRWQLPSHRHKDGQRDV